MGEQRAMRDCGCQPYGKHRKECMEASLKRCACPDGYWERRNRIPGQRHTQECPLWPSMVPMPGRPND